MANDLSYFQCRASQEKVAALRATHPRARQAHLVLAQEYDDLTRRLAAKGRPRETQFPGRERARTGAVAKTQV